MRSANDQAQLAYAAQTNAAVRHVIADLEQTQAELDAAKIEIERLKLESAANARAAHDWRIECVERQKLVDDIAAERDAALESFAQAGAV